jgi:uncharacterized protein YwgA
LIKIAGIKLLILAAKYLGKIEGRKRFQKTIFLLQEKFGIDFGYKFTAYLYGPYSSQLQNDIDILAQTGYLKASKIGELFFYEITPLGQQSAAQIEKEYGAEMVKKLEKHVNDLKEFDTEELVNWSKQLMGKKIKDNIFAY